MIEVYLMFGTAMSKFVLIYQVCLVLNIYLKIEFELDWQWVTPSKSMINWNKMLWSPPTKFLWKYFFDEIFLLQKFEFESHVKEAKRWLYQIQFE